MATDFDTILVDDAAAIMADYAQTVTVSGTTKRAIVSNHERGRAGFEAGGFFGRATLEVVIVKSDWASIPAAGSIVTTSKTGANQFRVASYNDDFTGLVRHLLCEALHA